MLRHAWPWQLLSTTVLVRRRRWRCSRTAPHGDRRPPPGPGRRWSTRRTTALRAQETPPPGARPGILAEPGPQKSDRTVRRSSGEVPLLSAPLLADTAADAVDITTAKFLLRDAMRKLEEERNLEERRKADAHLQAMTKLVRRVPRKRKKRRKRRTPRTSSLPGRARRRQRQWFACSACFTGDDVPRVMFPSGVVWPTMLRIMAGMVQKGWYCG